MIALMGDKRPVLQTNLGDDIAAPKRSQHQIFPTPIALTELAGPVVQNIDRSAMLSVDTKRRRFSESGKQAEFLGVIARDQRTCTLAATARR
jgi:hypothetical protein